MKIGDKVKLVGSYLGTNEGKTGFIVGTAKEGDYKGGIKVQLEYHKKGEYDIFHPGNLKVIFPIGKIVRYKKKDYVIHDYHQGKFKLHRPGEKVHWVKPSTIGVKP